MWELITCRIPWARSDKTFAHQIMNAVMNGERPPIKESELIMYQKVLLH